MSIRAEDVKKLREVSGAGFMDCKKALTQADGDVESAMRILKEQGMAKAEKKSGRDASEGMVYYKIADDKHTAAILEVNCETDFVARSDTFKEFVDKVADAILVEKEKDVQTLMDKPIPGYKNLEGARHEAVLKLGENIQVKRADYIDVGSNYLAGYIHGSGLAVLVGLQEDLPEVGKNIAMHVAALQPAAVRESEIPEALLKEEREIYEKQLDGSNKPAEIISKIIDGKMKKFAGGLCLYGQAYVKDPKQTVAEYLSSASCSVDTFVRFSLGETAEQ